MFYKIKRSLFAIALLPLALGCKRETLTEQQAVATGSVATYKVQQWIKNHPLSLSALGRTAGNTLPKHTLQWSRAIYNPSSKAHTVPLLLAQEGIGKHPLQAALVATEDASGQIVSAQYLLLLPNEKTGGQTPFKGLEANGLPIGQADFSGTMLFYNSAGMFTTSKVFKEGRLQAGATATLAARKKPRAAANGSQAARTGEVEEDPSPNTAITNCDGLENECIDWYWQTYVNGVLVEEEYQFTTCCNSTGGGGGGENENAVAECQAAFNNFIAMGKAVNGTPTVTDGPQTTITWPKTYKWKIYDAVTWHIVSIEDAVWEKKYYPSSGQSLWEFKSFVHSTFDTVGSNFGGTRKFAMSGQPNINMQRFSTYMRINYTVTHQPGCIFLPGSEAVIPPYVESTYSENIFRIPGSVTVLQANRYG